MQMQIPMLTLSFIAFFSYLFTSLYFVLAAVCSYSYRYSHIFTHTHIRELCPKFLAWQVQLTCNVLSMQSVAACCFQQLQKVPDQEEVLGRGTEPTHKVTPILYMSYTFYINQHERVLLRCIAMDCSFGAPQPDVSARQRSFKAQLLRTSSWDLASLRYHFSGHDSPTTSKGASRRKLSQLLCEKKHTDIPL